jgi:hypothetical protein
VLVVVAVVVVVVVVVAVPLTAARTLYPSVPPIHTTAASPAASIAPWVPHPKLSSVCGGSVSEVAAGNAPAAVPMVASASPSPMASKP